MTTRSTRTDGRAFVFLSVDIARHPKILGMADPAAAWAWACAIAYCGEYETDGWITIQTIAREGGISTQKARKLVAAGLVHEAGHACKKCPEIPKGKAYLHDYLEHNRSKAQAEEHRRSKAESGKKGAAKRWATPNPELDQNGHGTSYSTSHGSTHSASDGKCMAEEEKEITTHPDKARSRNVTARDEREQPQREPIPNGPGATGPNARTAWTAVQATTPPGTPNTVRGQLARQAQRLLDEGQPGTLITAALLRLHATPEAGPGLLPNILADLQKEQAGVNAYNVRSSGSGARSARSDKVAAILAAGDVLQEQLDAGLLDGGSLRVIEGGRSA